MFYLMTLHIAKITFRRCYMNEIWIIGGWLIGEDGSARRDTCLIATLLTSNRAWACLGLNPSLVMKEYFKSETVCACVCMLVLNIFNKVKDF